MIRVAVSLYLLIVTLAAAIAWLAGWHGHVVFVWHGIMIETSVWVLAIAVAVIAMPIVLLWPVIEALRRALTSIGKSQR